MSQHIASFVDYVIEFKIKIFPDIYSEISQDLHPIWSQISTPKIYFPIKNNVNYHWALQKFAKNTPRIYWNYNQNWMTPLFILVQTF